jgi:hypothetical protein
LILYHHHQTLLNRKSFRCIFMTKKCLLNLWFLEEKTLKYHFSKGTYWKIKIVFVEIAMLLTFRPNFKAFRQVLRGGAVIW